LDFTELRLDIFFIRIRKSAFSPILLQESCHFFLFDSLLLSGLFCLQLLNLGGFICLSFSCLSIGFFFQLAFFFSSISFFL
jgi:hypothetical protein